jgi:hypothetical protein
VLCMCANSTLCEILGSATMLRMCADFSLYEILGSATVLHMCADCSLCEILGSANWVVPLCCACMPTLFFAKY